MRALIGILWVIIFIAAFVNLCRGESLQCIACVAFCFLLRNLGDDLD